MLDIYDNAVFDLLKRKLPPYFNTTKSGDDDTLDTTNIDDHFEFATPERPFAFKNAENQNAEDNEDTVLDVDRATQTLPSPLITLTRTDMRYDYSRQNTNRWRNVRWWDDGKTFWVNSHYPSPWNINYQIDIYARFRMDANKLIHWFLYWPKPFHTLLIQFGYPWGRQSIDLQFEAITDTSVLEAGENERWVRYTVPATLQSFMLESFESKADIPSQACDPDAFTQRVRAVKTFNIEICNWEGTVLYETIPIDEDGVVVDLT